MEPSTNPCNLAKIKHRPKAMCAIKRLQRNKMLKRKTRLIPEVRAAENASDREQHMRMRKQKSYSERRIAVILTIYNQLMH